MQLKCTVGSASQCRITTYRNIQKITATANNLTSQRVRLPLVNNRSSACLSEATRRFGFSLLRAPRAVAPIGRAVPVFRRSLVLGPFVQPSAMRMGTLLGAALATLLAAFLLAAAAEDHVVGGAAWRIPTSPGLYRAWADNRTTYVGDSLGKFFPSRAPVPVNNQDIASDSAPARPVFRFETGFYDVVQVGRREFDECTADDPYQLYRTGPAVIHLDSKGVRYYVCTVGNYCSLGVKMYVVVEPR
jgi:hypothetical protein